MDDANADQASFQIQPSFARCQPEQTGFVAGMALRQQTGSVVCAASRA
jgi:hypothetical protein